MADQPYKVEYKKSVEKELRKLPTTQLNHIVSKIQALAANPRPEGSVKLCGSIDLYRIRHAEYRVIYQILDGTLVVLVVKVGRRREVYRD